MRKHIIKLYTFEELSETSQAKAIEDNYSINVEDWDWWHMIEDNMEALDLVLKEFDFDCANFANITYPNCTDEGMAQLADAIIKNEYIDMIEMAQEYKKKRATITMPKYNAEEYDEQMQKIGEDFRRAIEAYYIKQLKAVYEWHTEENNIKETLINNEYEFTEDGKLF